MLCAGPTISDSSGSPGPRGSGPDAVRPGQFGERRSRPRRPASAAPPPSAPYTSPTRAVRASACATMFAIACCAEPEQHSSDHLGRQRPRRAGDDQPDVQSGAAGPGHLRSRSPARWSVPAAGSSGRRPSTVRRVSRSADCAACRASPGGRGRRPAACRRDAGDRPGAPGSRAAQMQHHRGQRPGHRVVDVAHDPFPFQAGGLGPGQLGGLRVHPRVDHGQRGMPGEQFEQGDVRGPRTVWPGRG